MHLCLLMLSQLWVCSTVGSCIPHRVQLRFVPLWAWRAL